jgi:hypothetical protein
MPRGITAKSLAVALILVVAVMPLGFVLVAPSTPNAAGTTLLNKNAGDHDCTTSGACTATTSLSHVGYAGDLLLVEWDAYMWTASGSQTWPTVPSDNESNSYTTIIAGTTMLTASCNGANYKCEMGWFYTTAPSTHGVTFTVSASQTTNVDTDVDVAVVDLTGYTSTGILSAYQASGSSGSCCTVSGLTAPSNSFVIGVAVDPASVPTGSASYVSFALLSGVANGEYLLDLAGGSAPVTFSSGTGTGIWLEAAVAIPQGTYGTNCPMSFSQDLNWAEICDQFPAATGQTVALAHQASALQTLGSTVTCVVTVANTGDIVVAVGLATAAATPKFTSTGDTFTDGFTTTQLQPGIDTSGYPYSLMFVSYATSTSSGSDTITFTVTTSGKIMAECFDFTGATATGETGATGLGTGISLGVPGLTVVPGSAVVAFGLTYTQGTDVTPTGYYTAGANFEMSGPGQTTPGIGSSGVGEVFGVEYQPTGTTVSQTVCGNNVINYGNGAITLPSLNVQGSGDLLVIVADLTIASSSPNTVSSVTGGGLTWTAEGAGATACTSTTNCESVYMWYATASGSGGLVAVMTPANSGLDSAILYDLPGVSLTGATTSTGGSSAANSGAMSVSSFAGASRVVIAGAAAYSNTGVWMSGGGLGSSPGFYLPTQQYQPQFPANSYNGAAQCGEVLAATTAPMSSTTQTSGNSNQGWAEYALSTSDPTQVTQPVQFTLGGTGGSTQTITNSGCAVTPTTTLGDGGSHSLTANPTCVVSFTLPGGYVWTDTMTAVTTTTTCSTGTCTTYTDTYELTPSTIVLAIRAVDAFAGYSATITVGGCGTNSTSLPGTGVYAHFAVNPSCSSLSLTMPSASSSARVFWTHGLNKTETFTTPAGPQSRTYYYSAQFNVNDENAMVLTVLNNGTARQVQPSTTAWADAGSNLTTSALGAQFDVSSQLFVYYLPSTGFQVASNSTLSSQMSVLNNVLSFSSSAKVYAKLVLEDGYSFQSATYQVGASAPAALLSLRENPALGNIGMLWFTGPLASYQFDLQTSGSSGCISNCGVGTTTTVTTTVTSITTTGTYTLISGTVTQTITVTTTGITTVTGTLIAPSTGNTAQLPLAAGILTTLFAVLFLVGFFEKRKDVHKTIGPKPPKSVQVKRRKSEL